MNQLILGVKRDPIPKLDRRAYLSEIKVPSMYLDELVRELLRHDFIGGVSLEYIEAQDVEDFKRYILETALGKFKLSLAEFITKHPLGSAMTEVEGVNLRSEVVFRLADAFSALPSVNKLHALLIRMFPVVVLDVGDTIVPFIPSRSEIEEHFSAATDLYNGNLRLAALVSNTIAPSPQLSVSMAGYNALCGLAQTEGETLHIQEFADITALGWPYLWSTVFSEHPRLARLDVDNHFVGTLLPPDVISYNLATQGRMDGSAIVGGKIRGGRDRGSEFPLIGSAIPGRPTPTSGVQSVESSGGSAPRGNRNSGRKGGKR